MKKLMSIAMAVCLMASMTVMASARVYDISADAGTSDVPIKVSGTAATAADVIAVDIDLTEITFAYTGGTYTWDPANHYYTIEEGSWDKESQDVNVTSHSNVKLTSTASIISGEGTVSGVTVTVDGAPKKIASAATHGLGTILGNAGTEQSVTHTVNLVDARGDKTKEITETVISKLHIVINKDNT